MQSSVVLLKGKKFETNRSHSAFKKPREESLHDHDISMQLSRRALIDPWDRT